MPMTSEIHPLAALFPLMADDEYASLRDSIREQGLQEPITRYEGKVLDGRHRLRACDELSVEPIWQEYDGGDPVGYIVARNIARRHLNTTEKAKIAALLVEGWGDLRDHENRWQASTGNHVDVEQGERYDGARGRAAAEVGTSEASVGYALRVKREAPELFEQMDGRGLKVGTAFNRVRAHAKAKAVSKSSNGDTRSLDEKRAERAMRDQQAWKLLTRVNGAALKAHQQQDELLAAIERCRDRYAVQSLVDTLGRSIGWIQVYIDAADARLARENWSA
jgi:hypothetical protein